MGKILVLGGTAWLGREITRQLVAAGQDVTCLARGRSGGVVPGAKLVSADRSLPQAYDAIRDVHWDEVIELAYEPQLVAGALDALSENAKHWILVSSISVYSYQGHPGDAEDAEVYEPVDLSHYGHAKVAAECASSRALGERLLIARPGLIAGPADGSDRFSYWVAAMARAGNEPIIIPPTTGRQVQAIDVRDLSAWITRASSHRLTGTYNVVGTAYPFAHFLEAAARVAEFAGEMIMAKDDWLLGHGVNYWSGPRSLPLWVPLEDYGFSDRNNDKYRQAGGQERNLDQLLHEVLEDEKARGLNRARQSGLSRAEELELLEALRETR
ncbi:NAD-dependent epimerase/dehydratase family protein [Glutamicibacter halophytocola]|uniref:NAD-dependent epimerase/dehydratase family protein n=1 Tax=Glutamicibacter halophytocola TaxID=1933880 RepID=UPI0015C5456A|nr:NAD-dependent epimerase/dehydratase family protein [Glutamicibacter halophytocola]NQD42483.1 reductase [Glutamicibacter halophytocola]